MSNVTDHLAEMLDRLDTGALTVSRLSEAREVISMAVRSLRRTDLRIEEMQTKMRDEFARAALTGLLAQDRIDGSAAAIRAYQIADAMLAARGAK